MLFYFTLGCILALTSFQADARECGGILRADSGYINMEHSLLSCIWVIQLLNKTGLGLKVIGYPTDSVTVISERNFIDALSQSTRVRSANVYTFEGKIFAVHASPGINKTRLIWQGLVQDNSSVISFTDFYRDTQGTLEFESRGVQLVKGFWAIEPKMTGKLSYRQSSDLTYLSCQHNNTCECLTFAILRVTPKGKIAREIENCMYPEVSGTMLVRQNYQFLVYMKVHPTMFTTTHMRVAWTPDELLLKRNVEGTIAGTEGGLYVIALNSSNPFGSFLDD